MLHPIRAAAAILVGLCTVVVGLDYNHIGLAVGGVAILFLGVVESYRYWFWPRRVKR